MGVLESIKAEPHTRSILQHSTKDVFVRSKETIPHQVLKVFSLPKELKTVANIPRHLSNKQNHFCAPRFFPSGFMASAVQETEESAEQNGQEKGELEQLRKIV